ncbi:MAG: hypothetical protein GQ574_24005 [Crocinitomix sp.]|nr:hypothetical protein [Crocinitomix sp.]
MFVVLQDTRNGKLEIFHKNFNYPPYYAPRFGPASKPACKAWIEGRAVGLRGE